MAYMPRKRVALKYFSLERWNAKRQASLTSGDSGRFEAATSLLSAAIISGETQSCNAKSFREYELCLADVERCAERMGQEADIIEEPYPVDFIVHYLCKSAQLRLLLTLT